ncbi:AMP-binding protein [Chelatococcus reniformis]|uniref:ATP-dependent acyl-CoA ligase n=1 Tax=Chelatococcus reniformis TaxID=1494448 RepID=A0A916XCB3_9HYPH|nr:AMP-binding protein [Chelatococcus reniformis]GGC63452.1 ATP-dependent acyl-CoA ligase [Chelatococcus reniformis]
MAVSEPRVPARDDCVLRYVLERRAAAHPDRPFIRLGDGSHITYGAFRQQTERAAAGLAALGVGQGDTVTVWLPNGVEMIRVWFAINWLGATYVPINVAYRGNLLAHVLANAGSRVIVASVDLVPRLADVDRASLATCVVVGGSAGAIPGLAMLDAASALDGDAAAIPALARPIEPWDVQSIIYTSGTTGRSKGVISSYAHLFHMSGPQSFHMLDETDSFLLYGPLFHVGGTLPVVASLNRGGAVGVAGEFSTETFWPAVRATGATFVILLGVMTSFIAKRPPSPEDRNHTLKKAMMIPLDEGWAAFAERFGVTVWTLFNMTEINVPIVSQPNPPKLGTCGRQRDGVELRIVDEHDCEVADGQVGELIIRTDAPWALNSGYFKDPEATAKAWRNGWFHTGDAFRRDGDGDYFFVDRMKDAIRRRGENISSFEVEVEILAHPAVRECAVVAVPNETSEDDVLAIVAPTPGATLDPAELLEFLRPRLAHFMLPRYVRVLPDLPRTPTQKVEKHVLRSAGVTSDVWDREQAGIRVAREKLRG